MSLSIRHWLAERHIDLAQLGYSSAQIAGIAFRIAQDMEVKSLNPFAIGTLSDVLELPLVTAWRVAPAISQLSVGLLRILSRKKPLRRNEGTWLTFQIAYLNALQGILEQEALVGRPWINRAEVPASQDAHQPLSDPQLAALLKTLRPGRLSDSQAEQAMLLVADSFLVQQMNNACIAWFIANGAEETEARLLVQRLSHGLPGHLLVAIAENPLPLAQLQKFVRLGNLSSLRDTTTNKNTLLPPELSTTSLPLNLDREYYRAGLACALSEPMLAEPFSLKDIYIPLKGTELKVSRLNVESSEELESWQVGELASLKQPTPTPSEKATPTENATRTNLQPSTSQPVDLMEWAMSQLEDRRTIAFIEAEPGGGKTSFCQMWAYRVARELYPNWMPVWIELRNATLGQTLEQTLETAFPIGRFTDTDGWFSPNSPPCLLILDGLDELPRSPQIERHLWAFMAQVMRFHSQDANTSGLPRHKIAIASRSGSLDYLTGEYWQSSTSPLSNQLRRISIAPMEQDEFRQWFSAWAKVQSKSIAQAYFTFLKHGGVFQFSPPFQEIANLVKRPLMLYLLGILHRDGWIDESIFQMNSSQIKFEIYDRICRWLLGEPAAGNSALPELIREGLAHASRSAEAIANLLEGYSPQQLRQQMQIAALSIIKTGQYQVRQAALEQLLAGKSTTDIFPPKLPLLFFRTQPPLELKVNRSNVETFNPPSTLQPATQPDFPPATSNLQPSTQTNLQPKLTFNLQPSTFQPSAPNLEFSHPCLGKYLGAEEIAAQLQAITQQVPNPYGEITFVIDDTVKVAQHLYNLLGYGLLSREIEELAIERLRRQEKRNADVFSFAVLFQRLYRFYRGYCQGQWLDEGIAHQAHAQLRSLNNSLNVLQVDAAVGLNVFLLLCSAAKEAQIPFWPCGNPDIRQEFDPDRLLSFIGRTAVLSPTAFWQRARQSLDKIQLVEACLNRAMLAEANFSQANLSAADLVEINLAGANLQNANLSLASLVSANLSNANLSSASLEGADLSGANLRGANLKSANLTYACLFQAELDEQSRNFALRSGAIFSLEEFQSYIHSLAPTKLVGNLGEDELLDEEPTIFIESAEGEPIFPNVQYASDRNYIDDAHDTLPLEEPDEREQPIFSDAESGTSGDEETLMFSDPFRDDQF